MLEEVRTANKIRLESEFEAEWFSGTGAGGQHRNKHQNCLRLKHTATGVVQQALGRKRESNYKEALLAINKRLDAIAASHISKDHNATRKDQVGSGMRGDKRRTYRFQDDSVYDSITGKSARCKDVLKGSFDLLWK